jgi:signal transduction histidine kinase
VQDPLVGLAEYERTLLYAALDAMPVALHIKDVDACRIFANAADLKLIGQHDPGVVLGKSDLELLPDGLGAISYHEDLEVLRTGEPVLRREQEYVGQAGDHRQVLLSKLPLRDDGQRIIALAGVIEDITVYKALQVDLCQQQKMESFAAMSSSVAHDFGNLLSPIIGLGEVLLMEASGGSRQQQFLGKILNTAYKANTLLKQLRLFSRLHEAQIQPVDLVDTVTEACNVQRMSLAPTITLRTVCTLSSATIQADPIHLFQMVSNLLTNALQSIDAAEGEILVVVDQVADIGEQADPRQWLRLKVSDTGQAIDKEALQDLFEPFSGARRSIGSGLRLAIVRGVVQNLRGSISVDSKPGHGTTFTILLPAPEAPEAPAS